MVECFVGGGDDGMGQLGLRLLISFVSDGDALLGLSFSCTRTQIV